MIVWLSHFALPHVTAPWTTLFWFWLILAIPITLGIATAIKEHKR